MPEQHHLISRRSALGVFGLAATVPLLAGCGQTEPKSASAPVSTSKGSKIAGTVQLAMNSATPAYEPFMTSQIAAFNKLYPNVKVNLRVYPPAQYANAINLSFTSHDAPDIYRLTGPSPATNMTNSYRNGWLQPLTPFLTEDFKKRDFPAGTFSNPKISGLYIGKDMYGVPLESLPYTQVRILYCNTDLLSSVGAKNPPKTWEEMLDIAKKITKKGKAHGFAIPGQNTVVTVDALASTFGPAMGGVAPLNLKTGKAGASSDSYVKIVDLLRASNADGVFTPGWESWNGARPIQEFALGALGMYVGANFHAAQIRATNPDLKFDMAEMPVPGSGRGGYSSVAGLNQPYWGMSKSAKSPHAAWALLDFMSTTQFQAAAYQKLQLIPVLPSAYAGKLTGDSKRIVELMKASERTGPSASMHGLEADELLSNATAAAPSPNAVALYTKSITENMDYAGPAMTFDNGFDAAIDATVTKLKKSGLKVSRNDLVFADWNPLKNYAG